MARGATAKASSTAGAETQQELRRAPERALVMLIVGALLWLPPLAAVFELDLHLFGVPFALFYLFLVWAGLILGTWYLARRLARLAAAEAERQ